VCERKKERDRKRERERERKEVTFVFLSKLSKLFLNLSMSKAFNEAEKECDDQFVLNFLTVVNTNESPPSILLSLSVSLGLPFGPIP
jgi:hypothetical protein